MSDEQQDAGAEEALVARLDVIEEQPLAARADAYAQLHEQLRRTLEGDDEHGRG
ncbi:hypothetical protein AB4Z18_17185 [Leifsonia sp. 2TAF2]|uniref:hypothetical protein n=1 Tax=Leifsonia sp. 2TAF2 TaxID=3233009 RepID=UPI003F9AA6B4